MRASIDQIFEGHVRKAKEAVDENTQQLIRDALNGGFNKIIAKDKIIRGLEDEPDLLLDFPAKFRQHFKEALADAVARLVAERNRQNVLNQLEDI